MNNAGREGGGGLFADPLPVYSGLLDYLGEPLVAPSSFDVFNARPGSPLAAGLEADLRASFAPHDEALAELVGRKLGWMS